MCVTVEEATEDGDGGDGGDDGEDAFPKLPKRVRKQEEKQRRKEANQRSQDKADARRLAAREAYACNVRAVLILERQIKLCSRMTRRNKTMRLEDKLQVMISEHHSRIWSIAQFELDAQRKKKPLRPKLHGYGDKYEEEDDAKLAAQVEKDVEAAHEEEAEDALFIEFEMPMEFVDPAEKARVRMNRRLSMLAKEEEAAKEAEVLAEQTQAFWNHRDADETSHSKPRTIIPKKVRGIDKITKETAIKYTRQYLSTLPLDSDSDNDMGTKSVAIYERPLVENVNLSLAHYCDIECAKGGPGVSRSGLSRRVDYRYRERTSKRAEYQKLIAKASMNRIMYTMGTL